MSESNLSESGRPYPLGASWDGHGTNFAVFSQHATRVELCLYDGPGRGNEFRRIELEAPHGPVWHVYLPGVRPGQRYGYRMHGPYRPDEGHRFNAAKLLIDPYAKAISGSVDWATPVYGHKQGHDATDLKPDRRDDAHGIPRSVVVDTSFDWQGDTRLATQWSKTVIYEAHVKGFTALHPDIPADERGTYRGLSNPAAIEYFKSLGMTAIELLPVQAFVDDDFLVRRGLRNYWGYNTIGFFAPEARYSRSDDLGGQVREFKEMVRTLHAAGLEVILDVVYNHTAEGGHMGPTLSFRGIDNSTYYRLFSDDPRFYRDVTGTGNTLNTAHPQVLKLVMDSLRYWVEEMHVDGFRFDLAPALAREEHDYSIMSGFFRAVHQDPVLSTVKLIAEPWDIGDGGYQLSSFPHDWSEWNDRYRDTTRRFWRGDRGMLAELGFRLTGSADLFYANRRGPVASINFVTAHDGFTMRDVVSYERKHNHANGEMNRDGSDHNWSWNSGVEGETADREVLRTRDRQIRNLLTTLFLSQGVPMLVAGDEYGRTQLGNNNAYCQDNELSWLRWDRTSEENDLTEFTRALVEIRRACETFRRGKFYSGQRSEGNPLADISWFRSDGKLMTPHDWSDPDRHAFAFRLISGCAESSSEAAGRFAFFVAMNADTEAHRFQLPRRVNGSNGHWDVIVSTGSGVTALTVNTGGRMSVGQQSITVLRQSLAERPPAS